MTKPKAKRRKRPAKVSRDRKQETIRFRATEEQKAALVAAAQKEGLDVSAWLRQLALRAAGALPQGS